MRITEGKEREDRESDAVRKYRRFGLAYHITLNGREHFDLDVAHRFTK
jgi:hypothetical protein